MKYQTIQWGEWVAPVKSGYRLVCCDCGRSHRMDFRLVKEGPGKQIQFRAFRARRLHA